MDILRFITAGNIDDGKSTLTGRLLLDTENIKDDILSSITGEDAAEVNLAHITDGLRAERQGGITIDVAYKYFTTSRRKFIITDAPGHFQYTKNLVTGASGADLMVILIDSVHGITAQTRRHLKVASFLDIAHIVVAVNKMDIVGHSEGVFNSIKDNFLVLASKLSLENLHFIPVSALKGDNVTVPSANMPWYSGPTLLHLLESTIAHPGKTLSALRFTVQYAREGYVFGRLHSGVLRAGDTLTVADTKQPITIGSLFHGYQEVSEAMTGRDVCFSYSGGAVRRGDVLKDLSDVVSGQTTIRAEVCWLDETTPLQSGKPYIFRINATDIIGVISIVDEVTDIETLIQLNGPHAVTVNDFAVVQIACEQPFYVDRFSDSHETGRGIIIDPATNNTSGAFVVR